VTVYAGYQAVTAGSQQAPQQASAQQKPQPLGQQSAASAVEALPRQLPEGWEMKKSRSTGRVYYVNEKLGKSQFEPPAGSTVKVEAPKKKKKLTHSKDLPDAQTTDKNGMMGVIRGSDKKLGRWQKWQQCSRILAEPEDDEQREQ